METGQNQSPTAPHKPKFNPGPYELRGHRRNEVWIGNKMVIRYATETPASHLREHLNTAYHVGRREAIAEFGVSPERVEASERADGSWTPPLALLGPGGDFTHPVGGRLDIRG